MNKEEYRGSLWKKKSKSGLTYCSGKIKIGANEYYITLFNNDKKGNEKAPDFNIIMRDSVISQEKQENALNEPKNSVKNDNSIIFEEFGKDLDISDDTLAF